MNRIRNAFAFVLTSLGVSLLACSLLIIPSQYACGDDGELLVKKCSAVGTDGCDNGCGWNGNECTGGCHTFKAKCTDCVCRTTDERNGNGDPFVCKCQKPAT
jgi:hypothetical protein